MYYFILFLASFLFAVGLKRIIPFFGKMAINALGTVNTLMENELDEDEKHLQVLKSTKGLLSSLFLFLGSLGFVAIISYLPILVYDYLNNNNAIDHNNSLYIIGALVLGGLGFLLPGKKKKNQDYSEFSKLLHRLILPNYNISKLLFKWDKKRNVKKIQFESKKAVIITGLARAGTTAFTQKLFSSNQFHSLSYANMPFLMGVNLWRKFYKPKNANLKERKHGDNIQHGYDTIEALEEYFFKVMLKDKFINDSSLIEHQIDNKVLEEYKNYQKLIQEKEDTHYLAKNNNFIIRAESLLNADSNLVPIFLIRNPLDHASSLLNQNLKFEQIQEEDPFALEYMDWLGHYEFGNHQKPFQFGEGDLELSKDKNTIDYWLGIWYNYYKKLDELKDQFPDLPILVYEEYLENPDKAFQFIENEIGKNLGLSNDFYNKSKYEHPKLDSDLLNKSQNLYQKLKAKSIHQT